MVAGRNSESIGNTILKQLIFSSFLLYALPASAGAQDKSIACLKLGADEGVSEFHPLFEGVVASIYQRIGHCAISISIAPKRSEKMLAIGLWTETGCVQKGLRKKRA